MVLKSKYITIAFHVLIWSAVLLLPYLFTTPESDYADLGFMLCNFFTLSNLLHIGLFYFNAYFLYSRLLNRQWWWLYIVNIGVLIIGIYHLKVIILNNMFPQLASD